MGLWNGYEQGADAHPNLPWWKLDVALSLWKRTDDTLGPAGATDTGAVTEAALAALDAADPLPDPVPSADQIWVVGADQHRVTNVVDNAGTPVAILGAAGRAFGWPPSGMVLAQGTSSPWATM